MYSLILIDIYIHIYMYTHTYIYKYINVHTYMYKYLARIRMALAEWEWSGWLKPLRLPRAPHTLTRLRAYTRTRHPGHAHQATTYTCG